MAILETTLVFPITNINFNLNLKYLTDIWTCNLILFHCIGIFECLIKNESSPKTDYLNVLH